MKRILPDGKPIIPDGVHFNLDMDAYHEDPAISKSGLVYLDISPLHYVARCQAPEEEKKHFSIGTLAHAIILQPNKVDEIVAVPPPEVLSKSGARSTKEYYRWAEAQGSRTIVTQDIFDTARKIADQVLENPEHIEARLLLTSGRSEISFFWTDPSRDIRIKVRPDHLPGADIIADLKTCRSAHEIKFGVDSFNLKYHWSAYLSCHVITEVTGQYFGDYRFVAVETEPPFDVAIYKPDNSQILAARGEVERLLKAYAYCYHNNDWYGYNPETQPLYWPAWAWRKVQVYDEFSNTYEEI